MASQREIDGQNSAKDVTDGNEADYIDPEWLKGFLTQLYIHARHEGVNIEMIFQDILDEMEEEEIEDDKPR